MLRLCIAIQLVMTRLQAWGADTHTHDTHTNTHTHHSATATDSSRPGIKSETGAHVLDVGS